MSWLITYHLAPWMVAVVGVAPFAIRAWRRLDASDPLPDDIKGQVERDPETVARRELAR